MLAEPKDSNIKALAMKVIWQAFVDLVEGKPAQRLEAARWLTGNDVKAMAYLSGIPVEKVREIAKYLGLANRPEARRMLRRLRQHTMALPPRRNDVVEPRESRAVREDARVRRDQADDRGSLDVAGGLH